MADYLVSKSECPPRMGLVLLYSIFNGLGDSIPELMKAETLPPCSSSLNLVLNVCFLMLSTLNGSAFLADWCRALVRVEAPSRMVIAGDCAPGMPASSPGRLAGAGSIGLSKVLLARVC